MGRIDILLWPVGGRFTILFASIVFGWKALKEEINLTKTELKLEIREVRKILRS